MVRVYILGIFLTGIIAFLSACKKDYYLDSGLQNGIYDQSAFEFLKSKPFYFDTLIRVIELAEMEDILTDSTITFFAPTNYSITKVLKVINKDRYDNFKDSLQISEVPAEVWKKFLSRYIFHGKYMLKDLARKDLSKIGLYPGMNLESWQGYIMNVGVVFTDHDGVKEMGPRRVTISSIGDLLNPDDITNNVATSDLRMINAIVHIIDENHVFGFGIDYVQETIKDYTE